MKIADSKLAFESTHLATQEKQVHESLKIFRGERAPSSPAPAADNAADDGDSTKVRLSDTGRQMSRGEALDMTGGVQAAGGVSRQMNDDPKLTLLRLAVAMLTGKRVDIFDAAWQDPSSTGLGIEYERHTSYTETEQTDFAAQGMVRTADGHEISFQISLSMMHAYHTEEHVEVRMGTALKDPLVLNFSGNAAELSDMTFRFDLDGNGKEDRIHALRPGSGFLVFDRNGDGKVNDGRELFGAVTGDGFGELAALDDDGNGWIDENDRAYSSLYVWNRSADGKDELRSLRAVGVAAIALAHVDTPFSIKNAGNDLLAQVRSTGVFLKENGGVGTVQKVDLAV
jgi:hypothetical protein